MSTHNLCFRTKIRQIYTLYTPVFSIYRWGARGSKLHERIFLIWLINYVSHILFNTPVKMKRCDNKKLLLIYFLSVISTVKKLR